jgi:hypothetical protein
MKRSLFIAAALALVFAAPVAAKGPDQATITGPGLDDPIVLGGDAEANTSSLFGRFVDDTGFVPGVFRQTPDPMLDEKPTALLGRRYIVVYRVPDGDGGAATVRQELYPDAVGGPVTYMRPGQRIFGGDHATRGGWFVSKYSGLEATLDELGFPRGPAAQPETRRSLRWLPLAFAGLLVPAALVAIRRTRH